MKPHGCLGIDFGTTNSYFCTCTPEFTVTTIRFEQAVSGGSLPTAILWRHGGDGTDEVISFGEHAINMWCDMRPAERKRHRFATQFKPDLGVSEDARANTVGFLRAARDHLLQTGKIRPVESRIGLEVVIGVPANWDTDRRRRLQALAAEAEYGDVQCVNEPVGALVFHLNEGKVKPAEARRGVLVIDFGGGTLDVAYLERGKVVKSWGDALLGGRLFDDVFFQWCLEKDPCLLERWEEEGLLLYHQMHSCREMKEQFSKRMAMRDEEGGIDKFSYLLQPGPGGLDVRNDAQRQFEARCRRYRPSDRFRRMLEMFGVDYAKLLSDTPVDLFDWIRQSIAEPPEGRPRPSDVDLIILTGGSANWPFFAGIVGEAFPAAEIVRSADPEAAVASGLSMVFPLEERNRTTIEILRRDVDAKAQDLWAEVRALLQRTAGRIAEQIAVELYDGEIAVRIREFRATGGRLAHLKRSLEDACRTFEPQLEAIATAQSGTIAPLFARTFRETILAWLAEHRVRWEVEQTPDGSLRLLAGELRPDARLLDGVLDPGIAVAGLVSSVLIGGLCGGAGVHLIAAGPVGWILGAVFGFAAAVGLGAYMERKIPLPARLVRMFLWQSRLDRILEKGRAKLIAAVRERIEAEAEAKQEPIHRALREEIRSVIDALSFVDTMLGDR